MTKVEAVVIGERVEPVIDAVETACGATPSSFIPVPGGYSTESHGHLGSHAPAHAHAMSAAAPATAMEPTV